MIGQVFGRLTVIDTYPRNKHNKQVWLCRCECGIEKPILGTDLKCRDVKSCGCLRGRKTTHDKSRTSTYRCWSDMKQRCSNKTNKHYNDYGGRGIVVCNSWENFEQFLKDMGEKPKGMSLDRIDNDKGYCLDNCRWATPKQQVKNRRNNRVVTYKGETKLLIDWCEEFGKNYDCVRWRLDHDWTVEDSFTK